MKRATLAALVAASLVAAGTARAGSLATVLVDGKKILVKDSSDTTKRKVVLLSKDPDINTVSLDPTVAGASLFLIAPGLNQLSSAFLMPASGWTVKNGKLKYKDPDLVNGPVKKALVKNGQIRAILKGSEIDFPVLGVAPLGEVGGQFTVFGGGIDTRFCFLFPGDQGTVKKDDPDRGIYRALKAEAPAFCPDQIP